MKSVDLPDATVLEELRIVLASRGFVTSPRLSRFLRFIVEKTLANDTDSLKESVVGSEVFDRPVGYDPKTEPIVRTEARRLRAKLQEFYEENGTNARLVISVPRGSYVAEFTPAISPAAQPERPEQVTRASRVFTSQWKMVAVFAALVVLLSAATAVRLRKTWTVAVVPRPFFSLPGVKKTPVFSPDGQSIAFEWTPEGESAPDLYVQRLDEDTPTRLTRTAQAEIGAAWSPDGVQVAFLRKRDDGRLSLVSVPARGGQEQEWGDVNIRPSMEIATLNWTPDGRYLVTMDRLNDTSPSSVVLVALESRRKFPITSPPAGTLGDGPAAVSPDGRWIAFRRTVGVSMEDLFVMPLPVPGDGPKGSERGLRRLTSDNRSIDGIAWTADGRSLIVSSERDGVRPSLYRVPVDGGSPVRLPEPGLDARTPAVARRGNRMAWVAETADASLWRVSTQPGSAPVRLIASSGLNTDPQYSPDGSRIVFRSNRTGSDELWSADNEGGSLRRLTNFHGPLTGAARWSPDGLRLALETRLGAKSAICLTRLGGDPNCIDDPAGNAGVPSWSHDGRWIYFGSNRENGVQVWKRPAAGGAPVRVTRGGGFQPFESPDGMFVYYARGANGKGIWRVPTGGGEETAVLPGVADNLWGNWAITRDGLYYVDSSPNASPETKYEIWHYNPDTKEKRRVVPIDGSPVRWDSALTVSPDGRWILFAHADRAQTEVMLMDNFD